MDAIIANIDSLYALLGLGILVFGGLVIDGRRREDKRNQPADMQPPVPGPGADTNGNGSRKASQDWVELRIAQHVQSCPRLERLEKKLDAVLANVQDLRVMIERDGK